MKWKYKTFSFTSIARETLCVYTQKFLVKFFFIIVDNTTIFLLITCGWSFTKIHFLSWKMFDKKIFTNTFHHVWVIDGISADCWKKWKSCWHDSGSTLARLWQFFEFRRQWRHFHDEKLELLLESSNFQFRFCSKKFKVIFCAALKS